MVKENSKRDKETSQKKYINKPMCFARIADRLRDTDTAEEIRMRADFALRVFPFAFSNMILWHILIILRRARACRSRDRRNRIFHRA